MDNTTFDERFQKIPSAAQAFVRAILEAFAAGMTATTGGTVAVNSYSYNHCDWEIQGAANDKLA